MNLKRSQLSNVLGMSSDSLPSDKSDKTRNR